MNTVAVTPIVRSHVVPRAGRRKHRKRPKVGWRSTRYGEWVLVLDTETDATIAQELLVGGYLLARWDDHSFRYTIEDRGLFVPDGAALDRVALVRAFCEARRLQLWTRTEFARLLLQVGYELGGLIVGFNLPFDLSRVAVRWATGRGRYRDGFRLVLFDSYSAPRIRIRTTARPRAFIEWGSCRTTGKREGGRRVFAGRFLDLQRWAHALTGKKLSLESACEAFGVPYRKRAVTYGRLDEDLLQYLLEDVTATWELYLAVREEWNHLPFTPIPSPPLRPSATPEQTPDLDPEAVLPHRLQSPAGIAKALLRRMGVRPFLEKQRDFPAQILGAFMSTLYGGHGECRIPKARVPVRYLDIASTYLNLARLLRLWDVIAAATVEVVDATEEVRRFAEEITLVDLYRPEIWPRMLAICLVEPRGDILPVVADWGNGYLMAQNPVRAADGLRMWWTLPDVIASKIRTGKVPTIIRALRVVPRSTEPNLRPVTFWGYRISTRDPFRSLLAIRKLERSISRKLRTARRKTRYQSIKAVQECFAYGIYAEMDEVGRPDEEVTVYHGGEGFRARSHRGERPGPYYHPLVAPFPPAATRLVVAMMEAEVHRLGGEIARFATDAVYIVATPMGDVVRLRGGSTVHALSYEEVDRIRAKFDRLAPPGARFWKLEPENHPPAGCTRDRNLYFIGFGTHRFALGHHMDDGSWRVTRLSMHGLGHLILPEGFAEELWREALAKEGDVDTSKWAGIPLLQELRISRPATCKRTTKLRPHTFAAILPVHNGFGGHIRREGVCRRDRIWSSGCPDPHSPCRYRERCPLAHPVVGMLPHVRDPREALQRPVVDRMTGKELRVNWDYRDTRGEPAIYPKTLASFVREHFTPDERRYELVGAVLRRRPVVLLPDPLTGGARATGPRNTLFELYQEWEAEEDEVLHAYHPEEDGALKELVRKVGPTAVARRAGIGKRHLTRWLAGSRRLRPQTRAKIARAVREELVERETVRSSLRDHPDLTALAQRCNVTRRTLERIRSGDRTPSPALLTRLRAALAPSGTSAHQPTTRPAGRQAHRST